MSSFSYYILQIYYYDYKQKDISVVSIYYSTTTILLQNK